MTTLKKTPANKKWGNVDTKWSGMLIQIRERLEREGIPGFDYSRPHGPYWFDKGMVDEGFRDWPGMTAKFPWETWILSKRDWPRRYGIVKQYYGLFNNPPPPSASFLNYNDGGNSLELRNWLGKRFPEPSSFEKPRVIPESGWDSIFFVHVPKTAGKSMLAALGDRVHVERKNRHKEWSYPCVYNAWKEVDSPPVVACVREPVDRAISVYRHFTQSNFAKCDEPHRVLREMFRMVSFSDFWEKADVAYVASVIKHLRPQGNFIQDAPIDMLLRFESLESDFGRLCKKMNFVTDLPHVNSSIVEPPTVTDEARLKIRNFYRLDYELYYPHL